MKALTLIRPWPWAIFHLPTNVAKRVENRTWAPPRSLIGETIALHAGKTFHDIALDFILQRGHAMPPHNEADHPLGIIGTARIVGWADEHGMSATPDGVTPGMIKRSPWFVGPVGWLLDEVRALPEPIPCRGAQGLWTVPADVEAAVNEQFRRAR